MNNKVFWWSFVVAFGGFLFGFDTAVISGAERSIQEHWQLNVYEHGLTISIALIGTIFGSITGSIPSDALGRKKTLVIIAALYLVSSLGTALTDNWYLFLCFRFLGGVGVGASSVTAPVYISEIAPSAKRGRFVALFQFNIVLGILVSYFSNYVIGTGAGDSWRWMLGVQALPSFIFLVLLRAVPETPRWLGVIKGDTEAAKKILSIINPVNFKEELATILSSTDLSKHHTTSLFSKKYRFPVMLAVLFAFFNQVSGINAIIYYAPRIFEMTGLGASSSLLSTVGIGIINLLFTLLAMRFIDRIGRRVLMITGSVGLITTLGLVTSAFFSTSLNGGAVSVYLFLYIAFFAFSQGAVIWVFIAEIFPNEVRAKGQTLGSVTHWLMAAMIAFSFPSLAENIGGGGVFLFFTIMMILQLLFAWKMMPETKGKSLEQIEHTLIMH
jgi:SP family arabinose:H+ symporter-like MFS transporter